MMRANPREHPLSTAYFGKAIGTFKRGVPRKFKGVDVPVDFEVISEKSRY